MITIPSFLTQKLLAGALAGSLLLSGGLGIALAFKATELSSAKEVIQHLEGWQSDMVLTIRSATGNQTVDKTTAKVQVQELGNSLVILHSSLKTQNDKVDQLGKEKAEAEAAAAREAKARAAAIATAEKLRDQLRVRAGTPVSADQMEAEVRRAQDTSYEAGL